MLISRSPMYTILQSATLCLLVTCSNGFYMRDMRNSHNSDTSSGNMLAEREVYSPPITNPDASTTWIVGSTVEVTWDVSQIPEGLTNFYGKLVLGYVDGGSDEHLDLGNPLADGFNITQGHIAVEVPDVRPSSDYIVVLFGDSGNSSPTFTIL